MKKKILAIVLSTVLALSLGLVFAGSAGAATGTGTIILESSSSSTETAGYTNSNPSSDPLVRASYENAWVAASDIPQADYPASWYFSPVGSEVWVSDTATDVGNDEDKTEDQWRLFRERFDVPCGVIIDSAELWMTSDNTVEAYLNNDADNPVGATEDAGDNSYVYDTAPSLPRSSDVQFFRNWYGPFDFEPVGGFNVLKFVVRNWYGDNPDSNPAGFMYRAVIEYTIPSLGELTQDWDYNPMGTDHTVEVYIDPAVSGVTVKFLVTGANPQTGTAITDGTGKASFTYTGNNPGPDQIMAFIDLDCDDQYDAEEPASTNILDKYWMPYFVTGGGNINNGHGKDVAKITFGGNVGFDLAGDPVGQWNVNFHNVKNNDLDKGHFHSTAINWLEFMNVSDCPSPDPPVADYNRANFEATGRFNGEDGWVMEVRLADHGEGKKGRAELDSIRILLWDDDGDIQYDSYDGLSGGATDRPGDFPDEAECAGVRTELDGGNFQIHPPEMPVP